MATVLMNFDRYQIRYYTEGINPEYFAVIDCYRDGKTVAQLQFFREAHVGGGLGVDELIVLYYSTDRFAHVVDILRNESPLWAWLDVDARYGWLATSGEEVGEAEIVQVT